MKALKESILNSDETINKGIDPAKLLISRVGEQFFRKCTFDENGDIIYSGILVDLYMQKLVDQSGKLMVRFKQSDGLQLFSCSYLTSAVGLPRIVNNDIIITNAKNLKSLEGWDLETIACPSYTTGEIKFEVCPQLTSLKGIDNVNIIGNIKIALINCDKFTSFDVFPKGVRLLTIHSCSNFTNLGAALDNEFDYVNILNEKNKIPLNELKSIKIKPSNYLRYIIENSNL